MAADNLQLQRFELKYVITEESAVHVRRFVQSYLTMDEFGASQPNLSSSPRVPRRNTWTGWRWRENTGSPTPPPRRRTCISPDCLHAV